MQQSAFLSRRCAPITRGKPAVDIFRLLVVITIFWTKFQKVLIFYKFLDII